MAFKNFKVETDADGIVLVTWDIPGRSMNVLDETSITELEAIVKQTSADAAVKGVVITSGKEALSRRRRSVDARGHEPPLCRAAQGQGRGRGQPDAVRPEPQVLAGVSRHRNLGQAVGRRDQRAGARRRFRTDAVAATTASPRDNPKTRLGLPEIKVGLFPGAGGTQRVPRIVPPQDAMQLLLKGEAINLDKAKALKLIDADRARRRPDQGGQGLDQGRRQGGRALGREGLQAAGRPGLSPRPA